MNNTPYGDRDPSDPEYDSVEEFAEYLIDDEQTTFTIEDIRCLNFRHQLRIQVIRAALEDWGLTYIPCPLRVPKVRGFTTNSNDRFYGPGSSRMHGGSGHEQINGFAGQEG